MLLLVFNLHIGLNCTGQCVQNWYLDTLEDSFALNLTVLLAATYYVKLKEEYKIAVSTPLS